MEYTSSPDHFKNKASGMAEARNSSCKCEFEEFYYVICSFYLSFI